ncbi:phytanoyl-CoA dioxygenase family protein [Sphingobium sp. V4]|uniref:phytanoyl-CoA dioxygenase family protein n=1 Tax=Sphingobium sp. V4 TaxID=3038927 RepID=UPI002557F4D0|nr:phytanoyl-CoA dioxygenase family protein [Sphingobium sp. V4]WIW89579.1 phytanoyl-CoA dioxygenase family protein [Sphingobium sp. V4]
MNIMSFDAGRRREHSDTDIVTRLLSHGYCVVEDAVGQDDVGALRRDLEPLFEQTQRSVGPFYGDATRRFHGLLSRSRHMEAFVLQHDILRAIELVLGSHCDSIQLNLTQAIEILPGGEMQPPHRDQEMWPLRAPGVEYLVNVMWPFTPYSAENGATVIWPGSHRRQDEIVIDESEAISIEMAPGSALLFLGSTLHAGGANTTSAPRRGMIVSYSLGWLKPYELPWLAYPPEIARTLPRQLAELAGYRAHRPNLGTHEGRCPSHLLSCTRADLGAIDALLPEQEDLIALYRSGNLLPSGGHAAP